MLHSVDTIIFVEKNAQDFAQRKLEEAEKAKNDNLIAEYKHKIEICKSKISTYQNLFKQHITTREFEEIEERFKNV